MKIKLSELKEAIKKAVLNEIGADQAIGEDWTDAMMGHQDEEELVIDMAKLSAYAKSIAIICDGEYGHTFFDVKHNHVWVVLGDSNAFDDEMLKWTMRDAIKRNYEIPGEDILITVEHEDYPNDDNHWVQIK
jgi:hypothetical protein